MLAAILSAILLPLGGHKSPKPRRRTPRHHLSRRARPRLEALEGRLVPAPFVVSDLGDNGGVNPAVGAGTGTLRQAIVDANASADASSTITFTPGLGGTINLQNVLDDLNKNITITQTPAGGITVKGKAVLPFGPVFVINSGKTCEINGLQINNPNYRGIVNNSGATLTLRSDSITNCGQGGLDNYGSLYMFTCTVSNNTGADDGGGIWNGGGTVSCDHCTISGNTAIFDGGGIYTTTGSGGTAGFVSLTQCSVGNNTAHRNGGGMYNNGCNVGVMGSNGSSASNPGGLALSTDLMWNSADQRGGGLHQTGSSATASFDGATIGYNSAPDAGGGCYLADGFAQFLNQCLISGNSATIGNGIAYTNLVNLFIGPNCQVYDSVVLVD